MAHVKKVLDHGYLSLVETWGSDESVVEAARMSTQKGFLGWGPACVECGYAKGDDHEVGCSRPEQWKPGDEKLLRFLWTNKHATPFEMAGAIVEVQAPIFVFREWHRHRTQSYNEMSARYAPLPDVNYIPTVERLLLLGGGHRTKQAGTVGGADVLDERRAEDFRQGLQESYAASEKLYQEALKTGVPKELARVHLPVGRFSRMRASANLRNWLAFLTLREAPQAQWEIRQYANALHELLTKWFPRIMAIYTVDREDAR